MDYEKISGFPVWVKILASLIPILGCVMGLILIWGVGKKVPRSAHWWKLKTAVDDIIESYQPVIRAKANAAAFSFDERLAWLRQVRDLLEGQSENAELLGNDEALTHWRNAQNTTRLAIKWEEEASKGKIVDLSTGKPGAGDPEMFWRFANNLMGDVMAVWVKEVWSSTEPGGGRGTPNPETKRLNRR